MPQNLVETYIRGKALREQLLSAAQKRELEREEQTRREQETQAEIKNLEQQAGLQRANLEFQKQAIKNELLQGLATGKVAQTTATQDVPIIGVSGTTPFEVPQETRFEFGPEVGTYSFSPEQVEAARMQRYAGEQREANIQAEAAGVKQAVIEAAQLQNIREREKLVKERTMAVTAEQNKYRETPKARATREMKNIEQRGKDLITAARIRAQAAREGRNIGTAEDIGIAANDLENGNVVYNPKNPMHLAARRVLSENGRIPINPQDRRKVGLQGNIIGITEQIENFVSENLDAFPESLVGAKAKSAWETTKGVLDLSELKKNYALIVARAGQAASAIGAEGGVKTQKDIERALLGLPVLGDTHAIAIKKIQTVKNDLARILTQSLGTASHSQKRELIQRITEGVDVDKLMTVNVDGRNVPLYIERDGKTFKLNKNSKRYELVTGPETQE